MDANVIEQTPELAALAEVIALCGGSRAELIRRLRFQGCQCSDGLVYVWEKRDGRVSHDYVIPVARAVDFAVSPNKLRPSLYPHPDDGLPAELRAQAAE